MTRTLAPVASPPQAESEYTNDLIDAADESVGRLSVVNQILNRRMSGERVPGDWDLETATVIIQMVLGRLAAAKGTAR